MKLINHSDLHKQMLEKNVFPLAKVLVMVSFTCSKESNVAASGNSGGAASVNSDEDMSNYPSWVDHLAKALKSSRSSADYSNGSGNS